MSNINDNNLDDLLRRAAEKYPLRTDSADWDKLVSDLDRDPSLILPLVTTEDRRGRRRFFWLFLLLPLAGIGYYTWHTATGRAHQPAAVVNAGAATTKGKTAAGDKHSIIGSAPNGITAAIEKAPTGGAVTGDTTVRAGNVPAGSVEEKHLTRNMGEKYVPAGNVPTGVGGTKKDVHKDMTAVKLTGKTGRIKKGVNKDLTGDLTDPSAEAGEKNMIKHITAGSGGSAGQHVAEKNISISRVGAQRAATKGPWGVNIPVKSNTASENTVKGDVKKDKIKVQIPKHTFYVGILGSPDLSTIKFQSVKNVGSSFGLLLGYSFNSRWAIESGVYLDRKKYYTDGEYFDKKSVPTLNYVDQLKVTGAFKVWEIPINVRYNFSTGERMKWFATAGLSSYLMSREKYDCDGYRSGSSWWKVWDNKVSYHNLFSIINLSVGFEQRLGKIGNLRLEPYLRIPMSGIGTGSLSIMSAGLNIGITRRIW